MLARAQKKDLDKIVKIHMSVLPHTLNAKIGSDFLHSLYSVVLEDPQSVVWVYIEQNEVIAFASITDDLGRTDSKIIRKVGLVSIVRALSYFIFHPAEIKQLIAKKSFSSHLEKEYGSPYPTILTIGVDPKVQSKGIGSQLIAKIYEHFSSLNLSTFYVDTELTNTGAISFYRKNGFVEVENFLNNKIMRSSK